MSNRAEGILEDMRKITMLTGEISSIHQESLQKWPYIVYDGVDSVEIKYDLTKEYTQETGEGYVVFNVDGQKIDDNDFQAQGELGKQGQMITLWVRDMLWSDIRVEIYINGKSSYWDSSIKDKATPREFKDNNGPKQD
jgi:hypothetical protein